MDFKSKTTYIRDFRFGDKSHFLIIKGLSILTALTAYCLKLFLGISGLDLLVLAAMAVFLLCSGFGLSESFERKGGLYHFWENKVLKLWLPSLIIITVCTIIEAADDPIEWITTFPLALKGNLLNLIFVYYLAFWLAFRFVSKKVWRISGLFIIAVLIFFLVPTDLRQVVFCFPAGVLLSQLGWKRKVREFQWYRVLAVVLVGAIAAAGGWFLAKKLANPYLHDGLMQVSLLGWVVFLASFVYAVRKVPVWGVFAPFGYMAYMIYLFYEEMLDVAKKSGDWKIVVGTVLMLLFTSLLASLLAEYLLEISKKKRRRKSPKLKGSMRR